ncbi:uncharacterized protein BT62DRAFT_1074993 [Guyanagaster necrorhizus]|uniref:Zn(2)-C6 fungal-type domain-containing protein n=1 Tax=Guyanagaster necrorhizus TaxID=856835 RepID=A0A9P8AV74_9AGAR|nr:uncharacterized protein BT62DRAFT_1074993 [Guyanagaster necrorhizus MCA 3950]KAG7447622.1 hypothetical protein BT62DRAFT_1074993 [Guyanagaster necrorhizus MCA 3950]
MKRSRDTKASPTEDSVARSSRSRSKRSKVQACSSCRRHKTRCEVLDLERSVVRCHRCNVLKIDCSYEDMDKSLFAPEPSVAKSFPQSSAEAATMQSAYDLGVGGRLLDSGMSSGSPSTISDSPLAAGSDSNSDFPRPDNMWSFVPHRLDWSMPLVAIQELARQPQQDQFHTSAMNDQSLSSILSQAEIDHLVTLFSVNYVPWLNFTLAGEGPTPFLDLVCCTVASRYLDASTRALVAPRLQRLAEDTIARMIFNPELFESQETVKGLIILSLWTPICGPSKGGGRDGRMLISMAVSMALNLGLSEASATAISIRDKLPYDQAAVDEATNKARLWVTLSTTESMLCIGTRRTPLSRRSPTDLSIFPIISPSNVSDGRDLRIRLLAEIYNAAEQGMAVEFATREDTEAWYNGVSNSLAAMDRLSRLVLPLSVVLSHDQFYYHMLLLLLQGARLLVLYHAIQLARRAVRNVDGETNMFWFLEIKPHGLNVVTIWGKECLSMGEAILVSLLKADKSLLPTTPDITFMTIALAGALVVGVKYLMVERVGIELLGSGDALLEQSVQYLSQAAFSRDHVAERCSALLHTMYSSWMKRQKAEFIYLSPLELHQSGAAAPGVFPTSGVGTEGHEADASDPSMFQDIQFWSTLFGGQGGADSTVYPPSNMRETYT